MKKLFLLLMVAALAFPGVASAGDVTMISRDVPVGPRTLAAATTPPLRFNMLGLHWQGGGTVAYRTRAASGRWSAWRLADADVAPDASSGEQSRPGWHAGNLDWTGASAGVQFRTRGSVSRLRAYYLWSKPRKPTARKLSITGSPAVIPRSSWLADERIVRSKPRYASALKMAVVHHTAGSNAYTPAQARAIVRGIEVYHVKGNGWNDVGYNFLVDRFGNVYEGRAGGMDRNVIGAHSQGFNTGTVGVALIGNNTALTPPKVQQDALVKLLAWRLDVGHVDPLSRVTLTSGGNTKFRAGRSVTLRAISGHLDTGPSECPGKRAYALLPSIAASVAATGLPKLYAPGASGTLGGPIRFQARLSSARPWTVTVTSVAGKVLARGSGRSALVDWTWSSAGLGKGPFAWAIAAGASVLPATGALPDTIATAPGPPAPGPGSPFAGILTGVTVTPSTLSPSVTGAGVATTVGFTLAKPSAVTVKVTNAAGNATLLTLLSANVAVGQSSFQWDVGSLLDGRYRLVVSAQPSGGTRVSQSVDLVIVRTLSGLTAAPAVFSPNGDGVDDTVTLSFLLAQPSSVQVVIQRLGATVASAYYGQLGKGLQAIGWDGTAGGVPLPAGEYVAVVTATGPLGAVSLLVPVRILPPPVPPAAPVVPPVVVPPVVEEPVAPPPS
jgi:hypothetical protein